LQRTGRRGHIPPAEAAAGFEGCAGACAAGVVVGNPENTEGAAADTGEVLP
jgi:hypothetical protein